MWGLGIMRIGGRRDARTRGGGPRGHWGMWDIREREVGTQGLGGMGICGMWEGDGDTGMGGGQIWRQKHEDKGTGGQGGHGDTRTARHRNRRMRRGTGRQGTRGHRNRGIWEQEGVESPATLLLTGTWGALCCLLCGDRQGNDPNDPVEHWEPHSVSYEECAAASVGPLPWGHVCGAVQCHSAPQYPMSPMSPTPSCPHPPLLLASPSALTFIPCSAPTGLSAAPSVPPWHCGHGLALSMHDALSGTVSPSCHSPLLQEDTES